MEQFVQYNVACCHILISVLVFVGRRCRRTTINKFNKSALTFALEIIKIAGRLCDPTIIFYAFCARRLDVKYFWTDNNCIFVHFLLFIGPLSWIDSICTSGWVFFARSVEIITTDRCLPRLPIFRIPKICPFESMHIVENRCRLVRNCVQIFI
jgi:hypothetical protein